jgi:hypothetical protein
LDAYSKNAAFEQEKNKIPNTDYLHPYLVKKDFVFFQ